VQSGKMQGSPGRLVLKRLRLVGKETRGVLPSYFSRKEPATISQAHKTSLARYPHRRTKYWLAVDDTRCGRALQHLAAGNSVRDIS